jgi:hypothetical protein
VSFRDKATMIAVCFLIVVITTAALIELAHWLGLG